MVSMVDPHVLYREFSEDCVQVVRVLRALHLRLIYAIVIPRAGNAG